MATYTHEKLLNAPIPRPDQQGIDATHTRLFLNSGTRDVEIINIYRDQAIPASQPNLLTTINEAVAGNSNLTLICAGDFNLHCKSLGHPQGSHKRMHPHNLALDFDSLINSSRNILSLNTSNKPTRSSPPSAPSSIDGTILYPTQLSRPPPPPHVSLDNPRRF